MKRIGSRGFLTLSLVGVLLGATAATASAAVTLSPTSADFGTPPGERGKPDRPGKPGKPDRPGKPGKPGPTLTLDLTAKKQELRKKLKFFATTNHASDLVATGKAIKETTKELAANQKTKVKAKLRRKARKRLEDKLDEDGKAQTKVKGTAIRQSGATATDTVKVKFKD
jgi:hypothetical protein